jgi:tetratricopeptide (TPR) repeat protein
MYRKNFIEDSNITSLITRAAMCAGLLLVLFATQLLAVPQQKPSIADDAASTEKKNGSTSKENANKPTDATRNGNRRKQRLAPAALLEVVFTTDLPDSDIFLNSPGGTPQKLGKTDAEGKLSYKLPRGSHSVTVSHIGQRTERQQIDVRPGNTNFSFNVALPTPKASPEETKTEETPAPADDAAAKEAAADNVEEIIKRHLDAQQTANVSASDWQLVETYHTTESEKDPANKQLKARVLFAQGQLAYLRGDYAGALVAFNKAVLAEPELVAAHYSLGNAYLATNQPAQAVRAYQRAAELNGELALAYKGLGDAFTKQGKNKEANSYYARAKRLAPIPSTASNLDSTILLMRRKQWPAALKELLEISKTQPTADVYIYIGDSYDGMKQPLSASQSYLKATELDPKSALAAYRYGEKMFELREYAAAMEALERALALDQTGVTINRNRAREMANKAAEQVRKMQ